MPSGNTLEFNLKDNNKNIDTVGTFMVPAQGIDKYVSEFTNKGFEIANRYDFMGLRGGEGGDGDEQTLLVWAADSSTMALVE
jgi:hypothetical protein